MHQLGFTKTCRAGLYRLHWVSGGTSLAAVGHLYDGTAWFAPINWTSVTTAGIASIEWERVDRFERLELEELAALVGSEDSWRGGYELQGEAGEKLFRLLGLAPRCAGPIESPELDDP